MDAAGAVPAGGWSSLFQTMPDGTGTSLRTLDPTTGAVASSIALKGSLSIRAVAGDGTMVALAKPPPAGTDVWTPVPRRHTTIVVADPSGGNEPETYRLDGNLEPEAFSNDGEDLFVIQYLPPEKPSLYRVASLELEGDGDVYPVLGRFKTWARRMPGTRLEQVLGAGREAALHALLEPAGGVRAGLRRLAGRRRRPGRVRAHPEPR